ncbi:MAG TPA: CocE/NonD family hydrolase [Bryobacteraceae bacterium]|nr:CocE/NonD family hydrolase [Bryobacteraceae bacterium]
MNRTVPVFFFAVVSAALAANAPEVTVERGVTMKTRDGVTLRADIYRPKADGKYPVLLQRTPYNKDNETDFGYQAAARGYVVIIQDVRGRYTSDGEWYPFKHESQDGYDAVEWAAALPNSNGKVGMFGASYVGATQMLTAIATPPHLAGIFPVVTASNYHDGWTYQGGAFEQWFNESWTSGLVQDTLDRRVRQSSTALNWIWKLPLSTYPLLDMPSATSLADYFLDWTRHPDFDGYWKPWSIQDHYEKIHVPAYNTGGWYDIFQGGTVRNYIGIKAHAGSEAARRATRLTVGPWYHGPFNGKAGDVDFGPSAKGDSDAEMLRWYDHLLKGLKNGVEREKPVKIFVMGKNVWREESEWPLARARETRYYLHSSTGANALAGDGSLSTQAPESEHADHYTYDPANPAPTRGGGLCCDNEHLASGAFDQRPVEERRDVLVFTTSALTSDFEITGPISVELYASSSAVDTDFTAKLVDVRPDGYARNLTDGILRARFRNSPEHGEPMKPGEVYKLKIDVWNTSNVFLAGHKLRLEISSSNFPRFDRNLNTGADAGYSASIMKAENSVYHDAQHPSALILPVVP